MTNKDRLDLSDNPHHDAGPRMPREGISAFAGYIGEVARIVPITQNLSTIILTKFSTGRMSHWIVPFDFGADPGSRSGSGNFLMKLCHCGIGAIANIMRDHLPWCMEVHSKLVLLSPFTISINVLA